METRKSGWTLLAQIGPMQADHPSIGEECLACHEVFKLGDLTTLITLGPGDDQEAQTKARENRPYNAVTVEVHWACATGERQ